MQFTSVFRVVASEEASTADIIEQLASLVLYIIAFLLLAPAAITSPVKQAIRKTFAVFRWILWQFLVLTLGPIEDWLCEYARKQREKMEAQAEEDRKRQWEVAIGLRSPNGTLWSVPDAPSTRQEEPQPVEPPSPYSPLFRRRHPFQTFGRFRRPDNYDLFDREIEQFSTPRPRARPLRRGIDHWRAERLAAEQLGFFGPPR